TPAGGVTTGGVSDLFGGVVWPGGSATGGRGGVAVGGTVDGGSAPGRAGVLGGVFGWAAASPPHRPTAASADRITRVRITGLQVSRAPAPAGASVRGDWAAGQGWEMPGRSSDAGANMHLTCRPRCWEGAGRPAMIDRKARPP